MIQDLFAVGVLSGENELLTVLARGETTRIERVVSFGQQSPEGFWYDQDEHEWVCLLQGEAALEYDDGRSEPLHTGQGVLIPAHVRHRVAYTSAEPCCVWICVFYKT